MTLKYAPFCFCCEKYDFFPPRKYKPENICQSGFVRCPIHITESAPDGKQWFSLQVTLRLEPSSLGPSQREPDEVPWSTMCLFNLLVSFIPLDRLSVLKVSMCTVALGQVGVIQPLWETMACFSWPPIFFAFGRVAMVVTFAWGVCTHRLSSRGSGQE